MPARRLRPLIAQGGRAAETGVGGGHVVTAGSESLPPPQPDSAAASRDSSPAKRRDGARPPLSLRAIPALAFMVAVPCIMASSEQGARRFVQHQARRPAAEHEQLRALVQEFVARLDEVAPGQRLPGQRLRGSRRRCPARWPGRVQPPAPPRPPRRAPADGRPGARAPCTASRYRRSHLELQILLFGAQFLLDAVAFGRSTARCWPPPIRRCRSAPSAARRSTAVASSG